MAEYIDKAELLRDLERKIKEDNERRMAVVDRDFIDLVNDATVIEDVVEVVRCKDCEYGREEDHNTYSCANFPDGIGGYISGECFCSYGERKGQK